MFAMNVEAGRKMYLTDSAAHLLKTPSLDGRGGVKSSATNRHGQLHLDYKYRKTHSGLIEYYNHKSIL